MKVYGNGSIILRFYCFLQNEAREDCEEEIKTANLVM